MQRTDSEYPALMSCLGFIEIDDEEACAKAEEVFSHIVQGRTYLVAYGRDPVDNHRRTFVFDPVTGRFWTQPHFVRFSQWFMPYRDVTRELDGMARNVIRIQRPRR